MNPAAVVEFFLNLSYGWLYCLTTTALSQLQH
jgi:hypothetical protein